MSGFLYSVLISLLNPVAASLFLLVSSALLSRRPTMRRVCFSVAIAVIVIGGNRWVVASMLRSLEWQYLPPDPVPLADAIVVLSGGTLPRVPPRSTIEISGAGDRVLYAAALFRDGRAPRVIVTGDVATGGLALRPVSDDIAELLETLGVPGSALVLERKARNTHDHAVNLCPIFAERNITRVLLVTSALHMRRSLGTFQHSCPAVDYIPAPTDYRITNDMPAPWYRELPAVLPTASGFLDFTDATHEYLGILYYRLRGWSSIT